MPIQFDEITAEVEPPAPAAHGGVVIDELETQVEPAPTSGGHGSVTIDELETQVEPDAATASDQAAAAGSAFGHLAD